MVGDACAHVVQADVVAGVSIVQCRRVGMYVSTITQKPLDISPPNLADGQYTTRAGKTMFLVAIRILL